MEGIHFCNSFITGSIGYSCYCGGFASGQLRSRYYTSLFYFTFITCLLLRDMLLSHDGYEQVAFRLNNLFYATVVIKFYSIIEPISIVGCH